MFKLTLSEAGSEYLWLSPFPAEWEMCTYIPLGLIAADSMFTRVAELTIEKSRQNFCAIK